jgi:hypothetical protein
MEDSSTRAIERGLAWCGPIFIVGMTYCWAVMGHNAPPPNVLAMTSEQLVSEYYGKYPSIGPGMIGAATFGLFYTLWSVLVAKLLREDNGSFGVLSMLELAGGILTGWLLASCSAIWATCAVLANQVSPDTIKMVHTFAWVMFDCTYMITTMQMVAMGLYTILNKKQTMFPVWAGWTAIAIGVSFVALVLMPFVTEGPFALPGLWNFWLIFCGWIFAYFGVYSFYLLKHVYKRPDEQVRATGRAMTA